MDLPSRKWMPVVGIALAAALACSMPIAQGSPAATANPAASGPDMPEGKTIQAGIKTDYFAPYTITVAPGWAEMHESDPSAPRDILTLTKGAYTMVIVQAGMGIEGCFFGGVPTPTGAAQLWQEYASGVEIRAGDMLFMRGTNDGVTHAVCAKHGDGYNSVTPLGAITYTTPNPAAPSTLAEMDAMVASMTQR